MAAPVKAVKFLNTESLMLMSKQPRQLSPWPREVKLSESAIVTLSKLIDDEMA